jgi:hypothetical protein
MKLEYKILWFEDQFLEVKGDVDRLESLVAEFGFVPDFVHKDKVSAAEIEELADRLQNYNPYDLIIFDYDLGGDSENGLNIASHLRSKIYTDMIFYSGKKPIELRKLLFDQEVDGVFIVHRPDFYDEITPIIEDHIKKMSDINNVRGVMMSETSAMDNNLRELLKNKLVDLGKEEKDQALSNLQGRLKKHFDKKIKQVDSLSSAEEAFADHFLTSFDNVRVALKDLYKTTPKLEALIQDNSIVHQVQQERNKLAHQNEELTNDGRMLLHGPKESREYNFEEFQRIRHELLEAHSNIKQCSE